MIVNKATLGNGDVWMEDVDPDGFAFAGHEGRVWAVKVLAPIREINGSDE